MTQAEINFVYKSAILVQALLDLYGDLSVQNVLWAGAPNYQAGITQADLDGVPAFADAQLTTTQLADAEYAMATILGSLTNAMPALAVVANIPALPGA